MIKKVSATESKRSFPKEIKEKIKRSNATLKREIKERPYVDSFIKHAKDSAPVLLLITGFLSVVDHSSKKMKLTKTFKNNLFGFFAPVSIVSSAVLSILENKKPSKSSK